MNVRTSRKLRQTRRILLVVAIALAACAPDAVDTGAPPAIAVSRHSLRQPSHLNNFKVAVLMIHFGKPGPESVDDLRATFFTGAQSTKAFYEENSYGTHVLSGDAFGWFQIPMPSGCNVNAMANSADVVAGANGINVKTYDQVVYYYPAGSFRDASGQSCGTSRGEMGTIGGALGRRTWINSDPFCTARNQEFGHNYGLNHSWGCKTLDAIGNCVDGTEYADPFDVMGDGCGHMNAVQKSLMGWFDGCNQVTASASGVFDIQPIELPTDGLQALRIAHGNGRFFYVENRAPVGKFEVRDRLVDPVYGGVLIHEGPETKPVPPSGKDYPYLLNGTEGNFNYDAALLVGKSFMSGAITITLESKVSNVARVRVDIAGGPSSVPRCLDGSDYHGGDGEIGTTDAGPPGDGSVSTSDGKDASLPSLADGPGAGSGGIGFADARTDQVGSGTKPDQAGTSAGCAIADPDGSRGGVLSLLIAGVAVMRFVGPKRRR